MQTARLRNTSKTTTIRHIDDRINAEAPDNPHCDYRGFISFCRFLYVRKPTNLRRDKTVFYVLEMICFVKLNKSATYKIR